MNYEINENTLAVISLENGRTKVIEKNNEYYLNEKAYKIMDYSCQYFGSSYEGRVKGSKNLLQAEYKLPILVEESRGIIFFPTTSPRTNDCSWISLKHIKQINEKEYNSEIEFKNGKKVQLNISYNSLTNQLLRSSRLESVFNERKIPKNND